MFISGSRVTAVGAVAAVVVAAGPPAASAQGSENRTTAAGRSKPRYPVLAGGYVVHSAGQNRTGAGHRAGS